MCLQCCELGQKVFRSCDLRHKTSIIAGDVGPFCGTMSAVVLFFPLRVKSRISKGDEGAKSEKLLESLRKSDTT